MNEENRLGSYLRWRRRYQRIRLDGVPCRYHLLFVKETPVELAPGDGTLVNLSRGGLCFVTDLRLPVRLRVTTRVEFSLHDRLLVPAARILWREDEGDRYRYGAEFIPGPFASYWELQETLSNLFLDGRA